MSDDSILFYTTTAVILIAVLLLVWQYYKVDPNSPMNSVVIDTPKGLIRISNIQLASELERIKEKMLKIPAIDTKVDKVESNQTHLRINKAIAGLLSFIRNFESDQPIEEYRIRLLHRIDDKIASNLVTPSIGHQTLLDDDGIIEKHTTKKSLDLLIKHIEKCSSILKSKNCNFGRINLQELYELLHILHHRVGVRYSPDLYHTDAYNDNPNYSIRNEVSASLYNSNTHSYNLSQKEYTPEKSFSFSLSTVEPMESMKNPRNVERSFKNSQKNLSKNRHRTTTSQPDPNVIDKLIVNLDDPDAILTEQTGLTNRIFMENEINRADAEMESEHLAVDFGFMDKSDLIGYSAPTTIVTKLGKMDRNYTTSRCQGTTPSDEELWSECFSTGNQLKNDI